MSGDDTIRFRPRRRRRTWRAALAAAVVASSVAASVVWFERGVPVAVRVTPLPPGEPIAVATEAAVRAHEAMALTVFRFAPNPAIVVLDFPDLGSQGRMLNRLAVWAEGKGQPHDRLLPDAELAVAIAGAGLTPETYYYGHDYSGGDVRRFFALADHDRVTLRPEEERLRRIEQQAQSEPPGFGAVISVTRAGPSTDVDAATRAIILHHELSHGEYFSNPAYATFVGSIWETELTDHERGQFRAYLDHEGYDSALEDLMANEMQAYLMHTSDPRFFDEALLGIPATRLASIRAAFLAGMPQGWLRDATPELALVRRTASAPRRNQGSRSSTTAFTARLPPRRRRSSIAAWSSRR